MKPHIVILGAGPAGLGAAYKLASKAQVTVLEQNNRVGGNAGSFELAGIKVDFGSHRLHPSCDPDVLREIQTLLGADLLDRPRHGRIRLKGRWIHFPLKPADMALRLPPEFMIGVVGDSLSKLIPGRSIAVDQDSFASVMQHGLGKTITHDFYFPYARKIWGYEPEQLSGIQARRRVSAGSLGKMARRVLSAVPGFRPPGSGRFFYPRQGFGQISDAYHQAARSAGANIIFRAAVKAISGLNEARVKISYAVNGIAQELEADQLWSTIPITVLARLLDPIPPKDILQSAENIDFRAMLLIYLVIEQQQFTEYDAHYFPEATIPITRLSEPKNYSASTKPEGRTVLCAELPCSPTDEAWSMNDDVLGRLVVDALATSGIPITGAVSQVHVERLRFAYPIYRQGYEASFDQLDAWIGSLDKVVSFGRQGLFAHDNTHHALFMAYCAANCIKDDGSFNRPQWADFRKVFKTHVVED